MIKLPIASFAVASLSLLIALSTGCSDGLRPTLPDGQPPTALDRPDARPDVPMTATDLRPMVMDPSSAPPDTGTSTPVSGGNCPAGQHECDGKCVDSSSPSHCGLACTPCPSVAGAKATCDGSKCGVLCETAGQRPCGEKCVGANEPCGDTCPDGTNRCNGICVAASSTAACGPACLPCPTSADGTTTCNGQECSLVCKTGFHRCGDSCKKNDDPAACGEACVACPAVQGGKATCDGTKCGAVCDQGFKLCPGRGCIPNGEACNGMCPGGQHPCDGLCVSNTEVANCGTSCTPCPAPANSEALCGANGTCSFKCRSGYHQCGATCKADTATDACGPECKTCPAVTNGIPLCNAGNCDIRCNEGFRRCGNACVGADAPCDGMCVGGRKLCGNRCIPSASCCSDNDCAGNVTCANNACSTTCKAGFKSCSGKCIANSACCTDGDCGTCKACVSNSCQNQAAGQDAKNECASGTCRTGACNGNGACGFTARGSTGPGCTGGRGGCDQCDGGGNCSNNAVSCYVDGDRDGYGSSNSPESTACGNCGGGMASRAMDCKDSDPAVHPGADWSSSTSAGDQNCNGVTERDPPTSFRCDPNCKLERFNLAETRAGYCGNPDVLHPSTQVTCTLDASGFCEMRIPDSATRVTLRCR